MTEANNSTCPTTEAYAIGSDFNAWTVYTGGSPSDQPPTDCQPYSGDTTKAIAAKTISKVNDTDNSTITGVAITYSNGICASTGGAATFTINSWCDPNVKAADT